MAAKMLKSRKIEVSRIDPRNPSYPWLKGLGLGGFTTETRRHGVETTKGTKSTKVRSWAHGIHGKRGKEEDRLDGELVEVEG